MTLKTAFIGLGAMGEPMAKHLHDKGCLTAVHNRTIEKAATFSNQTGVKAVQDLASLPKDTEVIITAVSADKDLDEVLAGLKPGLKSGQIVVDCSTVNPATAKRHAQALSDLGVGFIDAPVSGGVEGARTGQLVVMTGGDLATLKRVRPVLQCFARNVEYFGPSGAGQAAKAVNQVMVAGIAESVTEALALAERLDLPSEPLLALLGGGAAGSWFLNKRGTTMLANEFKEGFKQSLLLKDLGICQELARDLDIESGVVDLAIEDFTASVAEGHGDDDISGLIRLKRQRRKAS